MILEVVSAGLIISACLAIFIEEAVYSVAALAGTFTLTALLYALNGAVYVAVFQFAVAVGTLSILFLSGEMLSERPTIKTKNSSIGGVVVLGVILSLPAFFLNVSSPNSISYPISFGDALWNYSAVDAVLQGLVVLTLALGIGVVLYEKKKSPVEKLKGAR
jgi:NADH:ubiquinone oxidoreductase subunit 6 (subunit J)